MVGWKATRNVICQAIRVNRGGGHVVGAIELVNKHDHDGNDAVFDNTDEDLLASCILLLSLSLTGDFLHHLDEYLNSPFDSVTPCATHIPSTSHRTEQQQQDQPFGQRVSFKKSIMSNNILKHNDEPAFYALQPLALRNAAYFSESSENCMRVSELNIIFVSEKKQPPDTPTAPPKFGLF